jgi:hypothetical protein
MIRFIRQPPRGLFPYGTRLELESATGRSISLTDNYLRTRCEEMFGMMAQAREFWLEEGVPTGTWYHWTRQFWFVREHDLFIFYMYFHCSNDK